jgi:hypothetical protein
MNASRFHRGQIVRIKPEWEGDSSLYLITEWNEDRGFITPIDWKWSEGIRPQELVREEMIEEVQG